MSDNSIYVTIGLFTVLILLFAFASFVDKMEDLTTISSTQNNILTSGTQRVLIADDVHGVVAVLDPITRSQSVIDVEHAMLHRGRLFSLDSYVDIPAGDSVSFLFVAPNVSTGKEAHLVWSFEFEIEGEFMFYESPTIVSNGVMINNSFNRRRPSAVVSDSVIYLNPVVLDNGFLLIDKRVGSGKAYGGEGRSMFELVVANGETYLITVYNRASGSSNLFNYQASWYEVSSFET